MEALAVFWFRRDLRAEDNCGLFHALNSGMRILPVFIFDKDILDRLENKHDRRVDFIHQQLVRLNNLFKQNNSSLLVYHDTPEKSFQQILNQFSIKAVFINHDYEPSAIERDEKIKKLLTAKGVDFFSFKDQVIFERSEVTKADGKPYTIFTPFSRIWKQKLSDADLKSFPSEKHLNQLFTNDKFRVPSLKDIGFEKTDFQVTDFTPDKEIIRHYEATRNTPSLEGTTRMGVHLRFGSISPRALARTAKKLNETYLNELIWREFFMTILYQFPHVVNSSFKKEYDYIPWRNNEDEFAAWCSGNTGYPMVDAGMRQLNETGWMHNRVRMVTASFLTKHLLIDWRWGEAYFADKLVDFELSANNGNWQWAAGCGCDAAPYFRVFNPAEQAKKFDPDSKYVRRWVKEYGTPAYTAPVVDHAFARNRALATYKKGLNR
jgi:deoxyribodipyrimidine photo-lyase